MPKVKFKRKLCLTVLLGCFAAGALAGCGGFSGTHSISPATFFLPGLVQNTPAQPEQSPTISPHSDSAAVSTLVSQ
jgi:hypothetical protein